MILYITYLQNSTRKLIGITNKFNHLTGYRINLHKSKVFLYTNNKYTENETIDCTSTHNRLRENKISRNKPKQKGKGLFQWKLKPLKKKIKTLKSGSTSHTHVNRINVVKMTRFTKNHLQITKSIGFNEIQSKSQFLKYISRWLLIFTWNSW